MKENKNMDRSDTNTYKIITCGVEETIKFGYIISEYLKEGDIIALVGDYGTGKTYLSKGIVYGLRVPENEFVTSPAFDLIHEYQGRFPVYHMDFYRLETLSEDDCSWLDEYLFGKGICIIEWADKFIDKISNIYLKVELFYTNIENEREIHLAAFGKRYVEIIEGLRKR